MSKYAALFVPLLLLTSACPVSAQQPTAHFPLQPGEVAATCFSESEPGGYGLVVYDVRNYGSQPKNQDWALAPVYHHPTWTRAGFMGNEVFGLALDDESPPNIYVTSTSSYNSQPISYLPGYPFEGSGKVFKINGTTGSISLFAELPNSADGEGLGNIAYDPESRQFFATNFHDGRIYRPDASGAVQGAPADQYDPFAPAEDTVNENGFEPLGERLWGIAVHPGERRVYFGRWVEDLHSPGCEIDSPSQPPPADSDGRTPNEVWSVAIDAQGALVPGTETPAPEKRLPDNHTGQTLPVADIAFSAEGRMLLAERTMRNQRCAYAHLARVLEYEGGHGSWSRTKTPDGAAPKELRIGPNGDNAAGGVDYICPLDGGTELIAATGDALMSCPRGCGIGDKVYGLQLLPPAGGGPEESWLIDLNGNPQYNDKTQIGDVEAYNLCDDGCLEILVEDILCATDGSGDFIFRFRIRNASRAPAYHAYVADLPPEVSADPSYLSFEDEPGGSLQSDRTSRVREIRISGADPGERLDFRFTLHDELLAECCAIDYTLELPSCECAQVVGESLSCVYSGVRPTFYYDFTLENLLQSPAVSYVLVAPPADVSIRQEVSAIPEIGYGGRARKKVSWAGPGARPGEEICLQISTHDSDFGECCSIERCVRLPDRCFYGVGDPVDYDPLGDATLLLRDGLLEVSNLGPSGEDGVEIGFAPAEGFRTEWRPLDESSPVPSGAVLTFGATGTVEGGPEQPLGELSIADVGPFLEITADYSPVDSFSQRLEIYNRGELVATLTGHTGPVARIADWPRGCGKKKVVIDDLTTACYWPEWDEPLPIQILGGPTVLGDGLRIIAENPSAGLESLDSFSVQAAGIPSIVLTSAVASLDCNANGTPDDEDVAGGVSADVNGNFVPDECEDVTPGLELVLDTGFDQTAGAALAPGTDDDDWRVLVPGSEGPAKVVADPVAPWPDPLGDSRWISVEPWAGTSLPGVEFLTFENCFCLSEGTRAAVLNVEFVADDSAALLMNGVTIAGEAGSFDDPAPGTLRYGDTVGAGLLQTGVNCLQVEVHDSGAVVTGFSLSGTLRTDGANCETLNPVFGTRRR